jgi:hypothetical protein
MATLSRPGGASWWSGARAATARLLMLARLAPPRLRRGRRRHAGYPSPAAIPELTTWAIDREALEAALQRDWR